MFPQTCSLQSPLEKEIFWSRHDDQKVKVIRKHLLIFMWMFSLSFLEISWKVTAKTFWKQYNISWRRKNTIKLASKLLIHSSKFYFIWKYHWCVFGQYSQHNITRAMYQLQNTFSKSCSLLWGRRFRSADFHGSTVDIGK